MSERTENGGTPLLEVRDLTVHHGQLRALDRVSLRVFPGEVYAIIGANGAGKSTLLRTIAGLHQPTEGAVLYDGKDMTRVRPERRATAGIVMVPEGRRLFGSLPEILSTGLTVLLVEQDVSQALRVASHIQCLLEGHTTLEGRPSEVTAEQVEAAYFGLSRAAAGNPDPAAERSAPLWHGST